MNGIIETKTETSVQCSVTSVQSEATQPATPRRGRAEMDGPPRPRGECDCGARFAVVGKVKIFGNTWVCPRCARDPEIMQSWHPEKDLRGTSSSAVESRERRDVQYQSVFRHLVPVPSFFAEAV